MRNQLAEMLKRLEIHAPAEMSTEKTERANRYSRAVTATRQLSQQDSIGSTSREVEHPTRRPEQDLEERHPDREPIPHFFFIKVKIHRQIGDYWLNATCPNNIIAFKMITR